MSSPEDRFSRTVADAATYERWRAKNDPDSYYEEDESYYDEYDDDDDEYDEDYNQCCCNDPCCPCEGPKRGHP